MRRSAVSVRERLILALLLAFLIDTSRPVVHPSAHAHRNGERAHVHVGEVGRRAASGIGSESGAGRRAPDGKAGLARAFPTDLHLHLVRPLHVAHVPPPPPAPVIGAGLVARVVEAGGERSATARRATARAPPTISA